MALDPKIYEDSKIKTTFELLAQGKSKDDITKHFGYKGWFSVDAYFRRKGFRWNGNTFVPEEEMGISAVDDARFVNTKAGQIVRQLSQKHVNIRQIATKGGFASVEELGEYMKGQGYVWNNEIGNYDYDETIVQKEHSGQTAYTKIVASSSAGLEGYQSLLDYLLSKQEKLFSLLETESNGTLPRYKFKGAKANKTLGLPLSLQTLLEDYSTEFNVTQRDIIEIALAEFFKKYGYENQLNTILLA